MKKRPCQVGAIFHMRDIRRNVSPEFIELVLANVRGTNMAAVNREKHLLSFLFWYENVNLPLGDLLK